MARARAVRGTLLAVRVTLLRRRAARRAPERAGDARAATSGPSSCGGSRPPGCRGSRRSASSRDERVPQMAGAEEVVAAVGERRRRALRARPERARLGAAGGDGLDRVNVTLAATETFNQRNGNASLEEAAARVERILAAADRPATRDDQRARSAARSRARSIPASSRTSPSGSSPRARARSCSRTRSASRRRGRCARLVERVSILGVPVGGHFHDTRHTGVACAWAAVEAGATVLDASVGGLGGCPFAPRATGNVATEDVALPARARAASRPASTSTR